MYMELQIQDFRKEKFETVQIKYFPRKRIQGKYPE